MQEAMFFTVNYSSGFDWYEAQFYKATPGQLRGESTPDYMYSSEALHRIKAHSPDVRLVVILREPVSRAWSHFWYDRMLGFETRRAENVFTLNPPADVAVRRDHLGESRYASRIEEIFTIFGRDQVLVLFTDDLKADPQGSQERVLAHVGLDPTIPSVPAEEAHNSNRSARIPALNALIIGQRLFHNHRRLARLVIRLNATNRQPPAMPAGLVEELAPAFQEDHAALAALLGRELPACWTGTCKVDAA